MRSALLLTLCTAFAFAPAPQEPAEQLESPTLTPRTRKEFQETLAAMQGAWLLVDIDLPDAYVGERQEIAYMVVSQEFMTIEFHMAYYEDEQAITTETYFQSGTYRLSPDDRGFLHTSTLIGSVLDPEGRLVFEPPGTERYYRVETTKKTIKMRRFPDNARFEFERLATTSEYDFYGRPLPAKPGEGESGKR